MTYQQVLDTKVNANDLSTRIIVEEWKGRVTEYIENYEYYRLSLPDIKEKWAQDFPLPKIIPLTKISGLTYCIVKSKLPHHFHEEKESCFEDCTDYALKEMVILKTMIIKVFEENEIDPSSDDLGIPLKCDQCPEERKQQRECQPPTTMNIGFSCFAGEPEGKVFFDDFAVFRLGSEGNKHIIQIYYDKIDNPITPEISLKRFEEILSSSTKFLSLRRKFKEIYGRNNYNIKLNELAIRLQTKFSARLSPTEEITVPESTIRVNHEREIFTPEASDGFFEHKAGFYVRRGENWIVSELSYFRGTVFKKDKEGNIVDSYTAVRPILFYNINGERGYIDPREDVVEFNGKTIFLEGRTDISSHLHTLMSYETAQRFLNGETVNITDIYSRLIEKIRRFVNCHWDERLYDLFTCIAIATHFFDLFRAFPIIFIYGPPASGKGRAGKCIVYAGHRGIIVIDPTSPTFYRMMDALRPSFLFDELTMAWEGFQMHWRASYKRGAYVPRMEKVKDEMMLLRLFEEFGPTTATSTVPITGKEKEATESRFINVNMRNAPDPNPERKDPEEIDFDDIRNDLYLCRLTQAKDVEVMGEYLTGQSLLPGREWELWRPILTIAAKVGQDVLDRVWSLAKEQVVSKRGEQYEKEKNVIKGIRALMGLGERISFTPKELNIRMYDLLKEEFGYEDIEDVVLARQSEMNTKRRFNKVYSYWRLGHILKRMDLKPVSVPRGKQYTLTNDELKDLARRFGVVIG